jgi:hypothetical protein
MNLEMYGKTQSNDINYPLALEASEQPASEPRHETEKTKLPAVPDISVVVHPTVQHMAAERLGGRPPSQHLELRQEVVLEHCGP